LTACSSSGIEPNWDAGSREAPPPVSSEFKPTVHQQYRIEFRRNGNSQDNDDVANAQAVIKSTRNGVQVRPSTNARSHTSRKNVQQTSFVTGVAGQALMIQSGGDSYQIVLGVARGGAIEVGVEQVAGPLPTYNAQGHLIQGAGQTSSTRTRVTVPLGTWSSLSGFDEAEESYRRKSELGNLTGVGVSRGNAQSSKGLVIRVLPIGNMLR